ncbi:DUF3658 domain-containing protein [Nocardia sp. NPDC059240]|uniref:DUF3658 domain-containing protein n=1 Tax=Nocardia sp. NPDC059240 TaxID=3346786 RepID=UPI00368EDDEB
METLHLTDFPAAAETLRTVLDRSPDHAADAAEWFPEDFSEGPLEPDSVAVRHEWWAWWRDMVAAQTGENPEGLARFGELTSFWEKVDAADHVVVWYSRDRAGEWAFFHAVRHRLADRPFDVVELPLPVVTYTADKLAGHLDSKRPITQRERDATCRTWERLRHENQTFRVIRDGELVSAPADHYDAALVGAATEGWSPIVQIVAPVMADMKVGDSPLFWRVKSLVEAGALIADGDPWLPRQTRIKRAQSRLL